MSTAAIVMLDALLLARTGSSIRRCCRGVSLVTGVGRTPRAPQEQLQLFGELFGEVLHERISIVSLFGILVRSCACF